jgi:DNA-binding GntR family transcriptional regulator
MRSAGHATPLPVPRHADQLRPGTGSGSGSGGAPGPCVPSVQPALSGRAAPDPECALPEVPEALLAGGPGEGPAADLCRRAQVRRVSVRGQILDALRAALLEGELEPGEVYSAPVLGERFGVSATPVREAMQQLSCEGAVEVVPNRGFRVLRRDGRELVELAEVRALIEVPVVLRLARSGRPEEWERLRPLADTAVHLAERGDLAGYAVADRAFHTALLGLAGNRELVRTADELHRHAQWPRVAAAAGRRRSELAAHAAEHRALLDALAAADLPLVEALVRGHFMPRR